jgi:hypothetical protein
MKRRLNIRRGDGPDFSFFAAVDLRLRELPVAYFRPRGSIGEHFRPRGFLGGDL